MHGLSLLGKVMFESEIDKLEVPSERPNLVIYTDAGARPNPGFGGRGLHGYNWVPKVTKQGSGHPKVIPTSIGYVPRTTNLEELDTTRKQQTQFQVSGTGTFTPTLEVDVDFYIDWENSVEDVETTNNFGEVSAAVQAMRIADRMGAKSLRVITDSQTAINGITDWVEKWEANGWTKRDGSFPPYLEVWQAALKLRRKLEKDGCELFFDWIKGHMGDTGNEITDTYATIGLMYRRNGTIYTDLRVTPAKGYWKTEKDRHDFLGQQSIYYHTCPADVEPGVYYLGGHGKEEDLIGTRSTDGVYSVVQLDTPDPVLEKIRNRSMVVSEHYTPTFVYALLAEIYSDKYYDVLVKHPADVTLHNNPRRRERPQDLFFLGNGKETLVRQRRPALMAMKAVEALEETHELLIMFKEQSDQLILTDVTDLIYETVMEKKGKKEVAVNRLRANFEGNGGTMQVSANYDAQGGEGIEKATLTLIMGSDIIDRNALKRVEEKNPKVTLITWRESAHAFRYATITQIDGAIGIWINYYSNLHFTLPEKLRREVDKLSNPHDTTTSQPDSEPAP